MSSPSRISNGSPSTPSGPGSTSSLTVPSSPSAVAEGSEESLPEMTLMDHLRELRKRLLYSVYAIAILAVGGYVYAQPIFDILNAPYFEGFQGSALIGTGPAEAFVLKLKVALFTGVVCGAPFIFYQVWLFIQPGLYQHERRLALPFILSSTLLFSLGVYFAYAIIFPYAFQFFYQEYASVGLTPTVRMSEHLSTLITGLLGLGVVFQMPVLAYFLGRLGIITDRFLIDSFRYALVGIFVVAAVLTPPDVVTQCLFAAPLVALYGISILVVRHVQPMPEVQEQKEDEAKD